MCNVNRRIRNIKRLLSMMCLGNDGDVCRQLLLHSKLNFFVDDYVMLITFVGVDEKLRNVLDVYVHSRRCLCLWLEHTLHPFYLYVCS